ncbi:hypothetical protein KBC80_02885 [Candidatus Woesebacteria bacterium]|nr:hypothetical protein [Candidatus Woesebacteria bacterium]
MKKYKKILIVTAILAICLLGFLVLQKSPSTSSTIKPTVTLAPVNPTSMPTSLSDSVSAYTNIPTASFPEKVPYFSVSFTRNLETETSRIASLFNFTSPPQIISGSRGKYSITQDESATLTFSENPLTFTYDVASISGKPISYDPKELVTTSAQQLEDLSIIRSPLVVVNETLSYFAPRGPSPNKLQNSNGATLVQIDFDFQVGKFPLFVGDADTPGATTRFDGDKNLIQIRTYIPPNITTGTDEVNIISYKEATERLAAGSGILSSVSSAEIDNIFLTGATPKNIEVSRVQLGYLLLSGRNDLVPVFIFSGKGRLEENNKAVNTTTIISALP